MVRLEFGGSLRETDDHRVDGRRHQAEEGGAQDEAYRRADQKGTGDHRPVLLHQISHDRTDDTRDNADADTDHQQDRVDEVIGNDRGPSSCLEQLKDEAGREVK